MILKNYFKIFFNSVLDQNPRFLISFEMLFHILLGCAEYRITIQYDSYPDNDSYPVVFRIIIKPDLLGKMIGKSE